MHRFVLFAALILYVCALPAPRWWRRTGPPRRLCGWSGKTTFDPRLRRLRPNGEGV